MRFQKRKMMRLTMTGLLAALALLVCLGLAMAQEPGADAATGDSGTTGDTSTGDTATDDAASPALNNAVAVERAENLAALAAAQPDPEVEAALADVTTAQTALDAALATGDEQAIADARAALAAAQATADAAMADATSLTAADIGAMREDGMGWGQIAHELGLHPSVLGMRYGHQVRTATQNKAQGVTKSQTRNAVASGFGYTTRNTKRAGTDTPGVSMKKGRISTSGNALGLGKAQASAHSSNGHGNSAGGKGSSSSHGNSSGHSNSGGNGNGNGNGNGGGNGGGKGGGKGGN